MSRARLLDGFFALAQALDARERPPFAPRASVSASVHWPRESVFSAEPGLHFRLTLTFVPLSDFAEVTAEEVSFRVDGDTVYDLELAGGRALPRPLDADALLEELRAFLEPRIAD